ncbi:VOC family protein [Hamadaea tsunoensis]|uniref:VOC family protein n=1 Tax=Hamadaea tsunoensis TaxID=53368 RepID=UPI0003F57B6C|nr:VOC family protein [Hamadaea tsunoensis]
MIRWVYAFLDLPAAAFDRGAAFWTAATGTALSPSRGERDEFATLVPAGADPHLKAQAVGGDGGVHVDLCADDPMALAGSAVALGAGLVANHGDWAVLRSPGGVLFCAVAWHGETTRAQPYAGSRADQIALDVAPDRYAAEIAFWAELTGWPGRPGSRPEFHLLWDRDLPFRLLIQRLDEPRPGGAHLDLAAGPIEQVRVRHEELGATVIAEYPMWTVMRDPAGRTYCLTVRDPHTGAL